MSAKLLSLDAWIERQRSLSIAHLEKSLSATGLSHTRAAFSYSVTPARGSVLASPLSAHWDPEPDYFYHWVRDAAIVMNTVVDLARHTANPIDKEKWVRAYEEYALFSLRCIESCLSQDGTNGLYDNTLAGARQYLRTDEELGRIDAKTALEEPRFNPDGTVDLLQWAKPQLDGPALRALTNLNYIRFCREDGRPISKAVLDLLRKDLEFTVERADDLCIGPWEEDNQIDHHYFTTLCQLGAVYHGREWIDPDLADKALKALYSGLETHWDEDRHIYLSLRLARTGFDASQFMAALHAGLEGGQHSLKDKRLLNTVAALESYFSAEYPINKDMDVSLIGRSAEDIYYGNNPWFPTTFSLAEFYYKLSEEEPGNAPVHIQRADKILKAARPYVPEDGSLSEQFHRATGEPVSARHLTWSYAAFISAAHARTHALAVLSVVIPEREPPSWQERDRTVSGVGFQNPAYSGPA